jgi:hypothetical protein
MPASVSFTLSHSDAPNMLLRLSRLSVCLALAAAVLAFVGPIELRGLCRDIALALAGVAFMLWRGALVLRARLAAAEAAIPAPLPLGAEALHEASALVGRAAAEPTHFEAALHAVAALLRTELGARAARVYAVSERDGVAGLRELIPAQPGFRAPRREFPRDASALARALHEGRACIDLPDAIALPVLRAAQPLAVLELRDIPIDFEEAALVALLQASADALAQRDDALAQDPAFAAGPDVGADHRMAGSRSAGAGVDRRSAPSRLFGPPTGPSVASAC